MPLHIAPSNILEGVSSAPDSSDRQLSDHARSFRFPVHNRGRSLSSEFMIYGLLLAFIWVFVLGQMATYVRVFAIDVSAMFYAFFPVIGFLMLFNQELSKSRRHQVALFSCAVVLQFLSLAVSSWLFHFIIGLGAAGYFLDALIAHGALLRVNATAPQGASATVSNLLRTRFSLSDAATVNLLAYVCPILLMAATAIGWRSNKARQVALTGKFESTEVLAEFQEAGSGFSSPLEGALHVYFLVSILLALIAVPLLCDRLAPLAGLRRFGAKRLYEEYRQLLYSWFFYNAANAKHPAVLSSPSGTCSQRRAMFFGAMLMMMPVAMPLTLFQVELDEARQEKFKEWRYLDRDRSPKAGLLHPIAFFTEDGAANGVSDPGAFTSDALSLDPNKAEAKRLAEEVQDVAERSKELVTAYEGVNKATAARNVSGSPHLVLVGILNLFLLFLSPFNPSICLLCLLFAGSARAMAYLSDAAGPLPNRNAFTTANWPRFIEHLEAVNKGSDQKEIFWGVDARDQTPVIVPRSVLREHAHFLGDTGSGKTALGISPLIAQLLKHGDCSVVVIDMKADDQTLFELMRSGCKETSGAEDDSDCKLWRFPFSYFTVDPNRPCHAFNPLLQESFLSLTPLQQTDLLTTALGLQYGTDYGRKYYGDANFAALLKTLERESRISSFRELEPHVKKTMRSQLDRDTKAAASNLLMSVQRLASVPSLNARPSTATSTIDLRSLFEVPQAAYFSLPAATGNAVNADMGRLVLYGLIDAAQRAPKPRRQVFLIIDEFQRLVAKNVEVVLQMARSLDLGVVLSNQSMSDLNQVDVNILPTVTTNTRVRQYFGVSDPLEIKQLVDVSGERSMFLRTFTNVVRQFLPFLSRAETSYSETISPRLRTNDLIEASDHPLRSIFLLRRGQRSAQYLGYPFVVESVFHIPEEEHQKRGLAPWPNATSTATCHVVPRAEGTISDCDATYPEPSVLSTPAVASQDHEETSVSESVDPDKQTPSKDDFNSLLAKLDGYRLKTD